MHTPRMYPAAVAGPHGLIYAIGGLGAQGVLDSVEIFNVATNTWKPSPYPLPAATCALAAAVGPDWLIYAIGGGNAKSQYAADVYSYDPTAPGWAKQAPLLIGRAALAADTGPDGLVYAIGGASSPSATPLADVEAFTVATPSAAPDPYIGDGTYDSPFIILLDPNGNRVAPNFTGPPTWKPSLQYRIQAIVYNDSNVAAPNTTVGFWQFAGEAGSAGTLIDKVTVTVPANGSVVVTTPKPFSVAGSQGEYVAVSIANPESLVFKVNPTTATDVIDPTVANPPGSGRYGSAWRARPTPCSYLAAELGDLSPGDFNTLQAYQKARQYLMGQVRQCLAQYG